MGSPDSYCSKMTTFGILKQFSMYISCGDIKPIRKYLQCCAVVTIALLQNLAGKKGTSPCLSSAAPLFPSLSHPLLLFSLWSTAV